MEFIEVVSCGFAPMTVSQLSAGTAFEVKCPFAIDAIAGVYRGDSAGQAIAKRDTSRNAWPPAKLEKRRSRLDFKRDTLAKGHAHWISFQGRQKREDTGRKNPADSMYGKPHSNSSTSGRNRSPPCHRSIKFRPQCVQALVVCRTTSSASPRAPASRRLASSDVLSRSQGLLVAKIPARRAADEPRRGV